MTMNELTNMLISENIPKDAYCLTGGLPNECLCLNANILNWEVYYSERGKKANLHIFDTEHAACDFFYSQIIKVYK